MNLCEEQAGLHKTEHLLPRVGQQDPRQPEEKAVLRGEVF
jgi:hypothetical protein